MSEQDGKPTRNCGEYDRREFLRLLSGGALAVTSGGLLAGCGGGGGTTPGPSTANSLLYSTNVVIGTTGDTITAPAPNNVSVTFPPNTFTGDTSVTLSIYDLSQLPSPNTNLVPASTVVNIAFDDTNFAATGSLSVTTPYTGLPNPNTDYVAMSDTNDGNGNFLAIMPTINASTQTFQYSLAKGDFDYINASQTQNQIATVHSLSSLKQKPHDLSQIKQWYLQLKTFAQQPKLPPKTDFYIYNGNGNWLPDDNRVLSSQPSAILIHGIYNTYTRMNDLASYLSTITKPDGTRLYESIIAVDYNWQRQIAENGDELAQFVTKRFLNIDPQIDVFGHSMGGLVARWAIEKSDVGNGLVGCGSYVKRLFTFSTPHAGVPVRALATAALITITGDLDFSLPGVNDLVTNGSFLNQLDDGSQSPYYSTISYLTFAGSHWDGYQGKVGKSMHNYFTYVDLLDKSRGYNNLDGIVSVPSAQYSGLSNKSANLTQPNETYDFNHSKIGGEMLNGSFNLDNDPGTIGDQTVDEQYRKSPHRRLRDYILQTGVGNIGIQ